MAIEYTEVVMDHFRNPRNLGEMDDANGCYTTGSPACGDQVSLQIKVNKDTKIIDNIKFKSFGCASNIATASIVTELVKGKSLEYAKGLTWKQCCDELGGLPPAKVHCSILAIDTLKGAIKDYEIKHEGLKIDDSLNEDLVKEKLRSVSNPTIGQDILSLKQVNYIKIDEEKKNVYVEVMAKGTDDETMETIVEEVKEHVEEIKDVNDVIVKIVEE